MATPMLLTRPLAAQLAAASELRQLALISMHTQDLLGDVFALLPLFPPSLRKAAIGAETETRNWKWSWAVHARQARQ